MSVLSIHNAMKAKEYKPVDSVVNILKLCLGAEAERHMMNGDDLEAMKNYVGLRGFINVWDVQMKMVIQLGINLFNN